MHSNSECLICNSNKREFLFSKEDADYFKCVNCGLHFQYPLPSDEKLTEMYSDDTIGYQKQLMDISNLHANLNFKIIAKNIDLEKFNSVLEIGCGPGFLLKKFKDISYHSVGIEMSTWAKDYIAKNFGIDILVNDFTAIDFGKNKFDLVIASYVLEHLKDPDLFLSKIALILNPGGCLIFTTPNSQSIFRKMYGKYWRYYQPNEHLYLFGKSHIPGLLARNQLTAIKIKSIQGFKIFLYEFPSYTRSTLIRLIKRLIIKTNLNMKFWIFDQSKWQPQNNLFLRPMSIFDNIMVFAKHKDK